jgi:hypothetical protein
MDGGSVLQAVQNGAISFGLLTIFRSERADICAFYIFSMTDIPIFFEIDPPMLLLAFDSHVGGISLPHDITIAFS